MFGLFKKKPKTPKKHKTTVLYHRSTCQNEKCTMFRALVCCEWWNSKYCSRCGKKMTHCVEIINKKGESRVRAATIRELKDGGA